MASIGYYGPGRGDELLTEDSSPGAGFLADVVTDWEAACDPARDAGIRVAQIRTGIVQSPRESTLRLLWPLAEVGAARGAFAAEVILASPRGAPVRAHSPLREPLVELMSAAGLVRRIGTTLNQAVARLNATGQRCGDLLPTAEFCVRVIQRLDVAAEQLRRGIP